MDTENMKKTSQAKYSRINCTKSPASGADNVSGPRLMSKAVTSTNMLCRFIVIVADFSYLKIS
jgi:hypothetical protein